MGRKTKYRPEHAETLREQMAQGLSFEACCGLLGVNKDTGYEWIKRYPDFRDAKTEGETLGQLFWEQKALVNLTTTGDLKFNSTVFIFTMKNRFGWKDKKEISGTGPGGALLIGGNLSAPEVDQKIDEILARLPADLVARLGKGKPK